MANSVTDICNLALGHLGEGRIASVDEEGAVARACALHYAQTRDEVLRSHRWNFATTRAVLTRLSAAPAFGWAYQYALPVDCLRVLDVNESEEGDWLDSQAIVEGRALLTDLSEVRLVYIRKVDSTSDFDSIFTAALALKLSIALSETIRGTTGKTAELTQAYERVTAPLARRIDANEGKRRRGLITMNSQAIRARLEGV